MKTPMCPFLKKACIEHDCALWARVAMVNPQTGFGEDKEACAIAWMPILTIQNAQQTRGVQAAVETARNDICTRQDAFTNLALEARKGIPKLE
jgi:hypothetical protein